MIARLEILAAGTTAFRNVTRYISKSLVSVLPDNNNGKDVFLYFLGCITLKVSSFFHSCLLLISRRLTKYFSKTVKDENKTEGQLQRTTAAEDNRTVVGIGGVSPPKPSVDVEQHSVVRLRQYVVVHFISKAHRTSLLNGDELEEVRRRATPNATESPIQDRKTAEA